MKWLVLAGAIAIAGDVAERDRLMGEFHNLASRNHWGGVERVYADLTSLKMDLPPNLHMTAAEAARSEGRIEEARTRYLRAAVELVEAREALVVLERRFGNVEIHVKGKRVTALIPSKAPFAPDAKAAIERYHAEVSVDRTFAGWLPVGSYLLDGTPVEVVPGGARKLIVVE
jgi:hypothetical protein